MNAQEEYLKELAGRICVHLPGWDVGRVQPTSFQLDGPDGRGMIFWCCAGTLTGVVKVNIGLGIRLEVSGTYDLNAYIRAEDKPRITLSVKKGAEAIAKDVQRRFLPKYEAVFAPSLKTHNETMQLRDARNRIMVCLAEAFRWKIVDDQAGLIKHVEESYGGSRVDARYTTKLAPESERGWEVELTLKKLTMDQALRIADVLNEPRFPPSQLMLPLVQP